jgi:hypothetical protein
VRWSLGIVTIGLLIAGLSPLVTALPAGDRWTRGLADNGGPEEFVFLRGSFDPVASAAGRRP